jgi:hypothetical protein
MKGRTVDIDAVVRREKREIMTETWNHAHQRKQVRADPRRNDVTANNRVRRKHRTDAT